MIPKSDLIVRGIYRVNGHNFSIGIWDGKKFIGARHKFESYRLSREIFWDDDELCGTCRPLLLIGHLPDGMEAHLGNEALLSMLLALNGKTIENAEDGEEIIPRLEDVHIRDPFADLPPEA